jgi:type IX secretion system PorP/SprF family membrane protein
MKAIKSFWLVVLATGMVLQMQAQQLPLYSQYNINGFILNPAMTAHDKTMSAVATYRHQWTGMPQAPKTVSAAFWNNIPDYRMAAGGYIIHDQTGPTSYTGITGTYAYILPLGRYYDNHHLAFGLSFSLFQYRLRGSDLVLYHPDDQLVYDNNRSKLMPDAGAGIYYYNDNFYAGFSVPQLLPLNVRLRGDGGISNIKRVPHFYGVMGAKFTAINDISYFEPSVWIKYAPVSPLHVTLNARLHYNEQLVLGLGYATDNTILLESSFLFNQQFRLGYAFSIQFSTIVNQLGTNHELFLAYIFRNDN